MGWRRQGRVIVIGEEEGYGQTGEGEGYEHTRGRRGLI